MNPIVIIPFSFYVIGDNCIPYPLVRYLFFAYSNPYQSVNAFTSSLN